MNTTQRPPMKDRILLSLLVLIVASIIVACKTGADGKTTVDQEKLTTAFLAAGEAALTAKTSGASSGIAKQAAIQAGLAAIKTEPAPIELPVTESK